MHNFFSYSIAHVWNNLPFSTKSAPTVLQFRLLIKNVEYKGCQGHCNIRPVFCSSVLLQIISPNYIDFDISFFYF